MEQNAQKEREKILEIKNLCMEFPAGKKKTVKALNNVTFDIYKGENFGLVGESGCGKTTLGRTLIRLYDPTSGEILFNGKNISGKLSKADRYSSRQSVVRRSRIPLDDLRKQSHCEYSLPRDCLQH